MIKETYDGTSYKESANTSLENTLNFENCSSFTKYDFENKNKSIGSVLNLCFAENYILETIVPYLKANSSIKLYDGDSAEKYYGKPMKLSMDIYGTIEYWWILLSVNGYFNAREFTGWTQLIVPTENEIESIIDKEIFVNDDIGYIPANLN